MPIERFFAGLVRSAFTKFFLFLISASICLISAGIGGASQEVTAFENVQKSTGGLGELVHKALGADSSQLASGEVKRLNQQFSAAVILPVYRSLAERTRQLAVAGQTFEQAPSEASLEIFRAAWLEAASAWARSQAVAFGPVHSLGHSVALDFPLDQAGIDGLLADIPKAKGTIDLESVTLQPSLQGFEAMAYLLYGDERNKIASDFSVRERQYLRRLAVTAANVSSELLSAWQVGWNGYAAYDTLLATAGQPDNGAYMTVESGTEEIVRSAINALDKTVSEIIPSLLETSEQLNGSSGRIALQLLISTVQGIQIAYEGATERLAVKSVQLVRTEKEQKEFKRAGGIGQWVEAEDQEIDRQIRQSLEVTLEQLEEAAINPVDIEALSHAQLALTAVKSRLEQNMLPLVQIQTIAFR
ncbi:hypothetical protein S7335_4583 [Synechococcus sp. PCC 7335]|uniref:imelysin family protein n=1 Tax=Synechococcus sp. (strain ATCC 29403 / PCC 7335) TaxID=91464 RepID=UPI00017EBC50|nr:imelysin family protein [Synechococcus sp. PCC 7335]EDX86876.1 hypothetical protein S7335_4583 [Synechococcus sp. PCC 7335]